MVDNMEVEEDQEKLDCLFAAKIQKAQTVSKLLQALDFNKDSYTTISITKKGLKFSVEIPQCLVANAFLQSDHFQTFAAPDSVARIRLPLYTFLQCIDIFGSNAEKAISLRMIYRKVGDPLVMILTDGSVVTDISITTVELEYMTDFNFRGSPIVARGIILSEVLKEAFNELDWSSRNVSLLLSPEPPYFRLTTSGGMGSCQVDLGNDDNLFETFECSKTFMATYKLSLLQPSIKALNLALKTQFRVNEQGIMSLQHMCKTEDGGSSFIDFFIVPNDESIDEVEADDIIH